jgi:Sec-independent protein secretion pathway component TatC
MGTGQILIAAFSVLLLVLGLATTPAFATRTFRRAVLIIAILAAVITPSSDATSMLAFMAPMIALYMIGLVVQRIFRGKGPGNSSGPSHGPQHPLPIAGTSPR